MIEHFGQAVKAEEMLFTDARVQRIRLHESRWNTIKAFRGFCEEEYFNLGDFPELN